MIVSLFLILCMAIIAVPAFAADPEQSDGGDAPYGYYITSLNYKEKSLELINPADNTTVSSMASGDKPLNVVPCPGTMNAAILCDEEMQKIRIVNMTTKEIYANVFLLPADKNGIGTIDDRGCVDHIFWRPDGRYLYVVTDTFLAAINGWSFQTEKCFDVVGSRVAADMTPDGSYMILFRKVRDNTYIVDRLNTDINEIDKTRTIKLDFDATNVGPLRFSPDGKKAYAFIDNMGKTGWIGVEPNLVTIDTDTLDVNITLKVLPTVKSASRTNRMDLEISPNGDHLYMLYSSNSRGSLPWAKILGYNLKTGAYENTFYSEGREIGAIALSPDGALIYAADYSDYWTRDNTISVINATSGAMVKQIQTGKSPIDVKIVPRLNA